MFEMLPYIYSYLHIKLLLVFILQTIQEKEESIKSLMLQNKTLDCSVEYEKERNMSQSQEVSKLKEELESFKQQCLALENEKHNLSLTATTKVRMHGMLNKDMSL